MKLEERFTLDRLVALSLGGAAPLPFLLVWILAFSKFGHTPSPATGKVVLFACTLALPMAFSIWAILAGRNAIRRGLMDERWPACEQTKQYERLRSRAWNWSVGVLFLSALALPVLSLLSPSPGGHSHPWGGFMYLLLAPIMARTELLKLLAPHRKPGENFWLHEMKPIQSKHWGQPQHPPHL